MTRQELIEAILEGRYSKQHLTGCGAGNDAWDDRGYDPEKIGPPPDERLLAFERMRQEGRRNRYGVSRTVSARMKKYG